MVLRPFSLSCLDFSCTGAREAEAPGALASVPTPIAQVFTTRVHSRSTPPDHASRAPRREHGAWVGRPRGRGQGLLANGRTTGEQYQDNKSSTMINGVNPNAPPRGHTLLSFCAGEKKGKNKSRRSTSRAGPLGRLEPPPELRRTPSRASPGRDGGRTRYRPPSRHDGVEADRGRS